MKSPRKCKLCRKPGHRSDACPENRAPGKGKSPRSPKMELVSSDDLPNLKTAVIAVVDALEGVDARHRPRVIQSAQMILGGDA